MSNPLIAILKIVADEWLRIENFAKNHATWFRNETGSVFIKLAF